MGEGHGGQAAVSGAQTSAAPQATPAGEVATQGEIVDGGVAAGRVAPHAEGAGAEAEGQVAAAGGTASQGQAVSRAQGSDDQGRAAALADDGAAEGRAAVHEGDAAVECGGISGGSVAHGEAAETAATSADVERAEEARLERDLLQEEVDRLRAELESQKSAAAFRTRQLEDEARELRERAQGLEGRARLVETMDLPETPYEALSLAAQAFSDRIVVLDRARKSAEDFVKGDPGEVWAVLRSVAVTLHSLLFVERERGLANAFRDRTGYELALRDSKGANRNPDQKAERMVEYEGAVRDATMHIKGRGVRKGESLRVHFFVDYDKKKIVIAHCGEHLTTDRTSSM